MRANPEITEDLANKIGAGMVKNIEKRAMGIDAGMSRVFSTSNKDFLKDLLIEEEILSEVDAENLVNLLHFKPEGVPSRAKKRLKFDAMTSRGETVSVKDLMNRDAEQVLILM